MTKSPCTVRPGEIDFLAMAVAAFVITASQPAAGAATPQVGDLAPDFALKTLDDKVVELRALTAKRPVLLVVLRGWPGRAGRRLRPGRRAESI